MKRYPILILILAAIVAGCKTTEENYRAAYERAVDAKDDRDSAGNIYGSQSDKPMQQYVAFGNDTLAITVEPLSKVKESDTDTAAMRLYNVAVGRFRQQFNAFSMRGRVAEAGYGGAIVAADADSHYYVIAVSVSTPAEASRALEKIKSEGIEGVAIRPPMPEVIRLSNMR